MERDFMGLSVKQEIPDEIIDAAPVRSLPMQWSFSNNGSAHPQLLSFQSCQNDNPKTGFESLASTGLVTLTSEPIDSDHHKSYSSAKKNRYAMSTYPAHNRPVMTPQSNLTPYVAPLALPSNSPVVGTTDLRNSSKISNSPAQLTIFYNGSVCVYDNISPEKAQAIMLLAGNGPSTSPLAPVQASTPRASVVLDGYAVRSSPMSITVAQSGSRSRTNTPPSKTAGVVAPSSVIAAEPLKSIIPLPSVPANFFSSGTVPQFRRKSLARFLEKRKERVVGGSPYADTQIKSPASGSSPVSAIN